ncbi:ubiquinone biosynthesis monooxygenase COQ6, mitochondrial-like isoform X2 [Gordionus sp. m RMFG-2023]|uniref:ubiquinone biosynthesis monooxygenase COQ6, mitochondrial-like isoform X2 n=1 Tax=Gordionus sp. m RMFG-2023 TaxID=3053472 RepID=UPI0031FC364D
MMNSCKVFHKFLSNQIIHRFKHYDVIISGGGVVGLTMASALANNPLLIDKKIILLERGKDMEQSNISYKSPVYAITIRSKELFKKIGAWNIIKKNRFKEVQRMQIWDSFSEANLVFESNDMMSAIIYIIEQDIIISALKQTLSSPLNKNFELKYESDINQYAYPNNKNMDEVEVHLSNGDILKTQLLIGSDGYNSLIRKTKKAPCFEWDYEQAAIIATLNLSTFDSQKYGDEETTMSQSQENMVAWQKFTPHGVVALLPLNSTQSSLVWSVPHLHGHDNKLMHMNEEMFVDELNKTLWNANIENERILKLESWMDKLLDVLPFENIKKRRINTYKQFPPRITSIQEGSRMKIPLKFMFASRFVWPRVALIGDACHRVHPLAGQGLNLGLGDVECLQRILADSLCSTCNIGSHAQLLRYQTERLRHTVPIITAINVINLLYSKTYKSSFDDLSHTGLPAMSAITRTLGLQMVDSSQYIKKRIMDFVS